MRIQILTTAISAASIIIGSLIGAFCSYKINKKMYQKQMEDQNEIFLKNRRYEDLHRTKKVCENANIIRLDIANSIFQGIRIIQNDNEPKKGLYLLPICKDYHSAISILSHLYNLKELSDLYQLYAIIEKVNKDLYNLNLDDDNSYKYIKIGLVNILYKIYGKNYEKILLLDPDKVSYQDLYKNGYIKNNYFRLLEKLDFCCDINNLV